MAVVSSPVNSGAQASLMIRNLERWLTEMAPKDHHACDLNFPRENSFLTLLALAASTICFKSALEQMQQVGELLQE
nr:hypothetical protein CFP56_31809 [Quercus suber]